MMKVLATNERGDWVELVAADDIVVRMLSTAMDLVGVPVIYDHNGNVWPKPAEGWTIWRAEPWNQKGELEDERHHTDRQ